MRPSLIAPARHNPSKLKATESYWPVRSVSVDDLLECFVQHGAFRRVRYQRASLVNIDVDVDLLLCHSLHRALVLFRVRPADEVVRPGPCDVHFLRAGDLVRPADHAIDLGRNRQVARALL